jgi:hypothetical protein
MLDIFNGNPFSTLSLTDAINKVKYVPGWVSQRGIFVESGISTTAAAIEERNGVLGLVSPTGRGGPGSVIDRGRRTLRDVRVPHFQIDDAVMAESVQGVRAFGSETQLETVMGKVMEQSMTHMEYFAATQEYHRIGAIKGTVTYADGSTLNLYDLFGVEQISERDWDLDNASPAAGILRKTCAAVVRQLGEVLEGTPFNGVLALCGDAFFDDLLAHVEVRNSYLNTPMATVLREAYILPNGDKIWGAFEFGGIVFVNYRGSVGGTSYINTDKCHVIPLGVPSLFRTYYAPADYIETVNTTGRRLYEKLFRMPNDKGMNMEIQMNALEICTRPRVLLQGKRT